MATTNAAPDSATGAIGLCFSGGGYRAAAFHLGTLAYLYRVGLGESVRQISTVSGGTFIGARYALSMVEKTPFDGFFSDFYDCLRDVDLVGAGLGLLAGPVPKTPSGRHDLIVAMADVYSQTFMRSPSGTPYTFGQILDADIQLTEAVFNATEFRHGLAFRFQRSSSPKAFIGNRELHIRRADAREIRMADIVAASSCFPGGFEPFAFPHDFTWPGGKMPPDLARQFTTKDGEPDPVGLMDGGVFDNQGAQSLLYADERDPEALGMFVISDVDQQNDDLFPYPDDIGKGGPPLGRLAFYAMLAAALSAASVAVVAFHLFQELRTDGVQLEDLLLYIVPLLLSGLVSYALWRAYSTFRYRVLPMVPKVGRRAWKDLRKLRLNQVVMMLSLRMGSLLTLTSSVFMKRIRGLVYGLVYRDEKYKGKRVSNLVYHLASGNSWPGVLPDSVRQPSPALRRVTDVAAGMPTTLWFDDDKPYQQPCLIATGQATICFNLMKWIARNHGSDPSQYPPDVRPLWDRLVADWNTLLGDPYALLKQRLPNEKLAPPP